MSDTKKKAADPAKEKLKAENSARKKQEAAQKAAERDKALREKEAQKARREAEKAAAYAKVQKQKDAEKAKKLAEKAAAVSKAQKEKDRAFAEKTAAKSRAQQEKARGAAAAKSKGKKKKSRKWIIPLIIIGVLVAVGIGFYVYAVKQYSTYFYDGTWINGVDCSGMTVEEAKETVQDHIDEYKLTVFPLYGGPVTITAEDVAMTYADDGGIDKLMEGQNAVLWPTRVFTADNVYEVASDYTYDAEKLHGLVDNFPFIREYTSPENAYRVMGDDGFWTIVPEVVGTKPNEEMIFDIINEAVRTGKREVTWDGSCYYYPEIYSDNEALVEEVTVLNDEIARQIAHDEAEAAAREELTRAHVTLNISPDFKPELTPEMLLEWFQETDWCVFSINEDNIINWIAEQIYQVYPDNPANLFVNHDGELMKLTNPTSTSHGWQLDMGKTIDEVLSAVRNGETTTVTPELARWEPDGTPTRMYIEISIEKQTMWLYVDGEVKVETPVVTGALNGEEKVGYATATPKDGFWYIFYKKSPHLMKGPIDKETGEPEYELDVTYWMPFNGDVGIHDNHERPFYGGDFYKEGGSHGCVNTPFDAVEEIYNTVPVGTCVIVY